MGGSTHTTSQKYDGIIVQSSLKGIPVTKGWGTAKVGCNLVDYLDFNSKKVSTGKGGGAQPSYDYYATLVLAIALGPVAGIRTIYKDSAYYVAQGAGSKEVNGTAITISAKTPVQAAGLSQLFLGAIWQTPWSYLTSAHPANALGYSGIAYAAAENYALNTSATTPNFNFEVQFAVRASPGGTQLDDANPADILNDLLPDVPRWPGASAIASLATLETYCYAQNILLSPVAGDGRQASDLMTEILTCANSDCFVSEGLFQVVPMGDLELTGNGSTFVPNLDPIYSLTWDDLLPGGDGQDPIQWDIKPADQCSNYLTLGFLDRSQQYASDSVPAVDPASYSLFGRLQADSVDYESICDATVAATVAQLLVQRAANVRRTAQFVTSELFGLLDPMDLIEVPAPDGTPTLVRVNSIAEQDDGSIEFTVEEMLVGAGSAPLITRQNGLGVPANFAVDPGDSAAPVIINPPSSLTGGQLEAWIATAGGPQWGGAVVWVSLDGEDFYQQGIIDQPARFGTTTNDFPAHADPDEADTLGVTLAVSGGELTTASQAAADAQTTLCAVGTELIAYSQATLTGPNAYNLTSYIRRGLEGTTIADQPSGSEFLRLDNAVCAIPYNQGQIGKTVYVKLQSFNLFGAAYQDLDLCDTYTFVAQENGTNVGEVSWSEIEGVPALLTEYVSTGGVSNNTKAVSGSATIGTAEQEVDAVLGQISTALQTAVQALAAVENATNTAVSAAGQLETLANNLEAQSDALAAAALQQAGQLMAQFAATFTPKGLPIGPVSQQAFSQSKTAISTLAVIGEVTPDGDGFVLNQEAIYVAAGLTLALQIQQLSSATGAVAANLSQNYLTATQVGSAISAAELSLTSSIEGAVNATLSANYLTATQTNGAITTAVSAAEYALNTSIGNVSSNLSQNYSTTSTVTGLISTAVSAAELSLTSSIEGSIGATLSADYFTASQTNGQISSAISAYNLTMQSYVTNGVGASLTSTQTNLSLNYMTASEVTQAISQAELTLTSQYQGYVNNGVGSQLSNLSSTLSLNYLTSAGVAGAIAAATSNLSVSNSGSLGASVSTSEVALQSAQGALSGSAVFSVQAGTNKASLSLLATSGGVTSASGLSELLISVGDLILTDPAGNVLIGVNDGAAYIGEDLDVAGNLNLVGQLNTSSLVAGAVTGTPGVTSGDAGGGTTFGNGDNAVLASVEVTAQGSETIVLRGMIGFQQRSGPTPIDCTVVLVRDGNTLARFDAQSSSTAIRGQVVVEWSEAPGAGPHTYEIADSVGAGATFALYTFFLEAQPRLR